MDGAMNNMDKDMESWTRTWQHEQRHENMDEEMETQTMTWKHGRGQENMDEDHVNMEKWRHGDVDMETQRHGHGDTEINYCGIFKFYAK